MATNTNVLKITTQGVQAAADAKSNGFKISVRTFSVGDGNIDPTSDDTGLSGNITYSGMVSLVEVISPGVSRFTLDLPPGDSDYLINEIALFLDDGIMFARGVFSKATLKDAGIGIRIFAIVTATTCDLTTLDVTVGDIYSIPSVASVATLPAPNTSNVNAISVLDLKYNLDHSSSASVALKYGSGGMSWSFLGYSRIYLGHPDGTPSIVDGSRFSVASLLNDYTFTANELFVVQVVSGPGQGESRRVKYSSEAARFDEIDSVPFSALNETSVIALWRAVEVNNIYQPPTESCKWPPTMTGVPADWILSRGSNCPTWVAPTALGGGNGTSGMFVNPSFLKPNHVYFTGNGKKFAFDTGLALNSLNTLIAIDGITQHKEAYDVQGSFVLFSEAPPPGTMIEVIVFTDETSTGTQLEFHTEIMEGDGVTTRFILNIDVANGEPPNEHYILCYITGIKQNLNAFLYEKDPNTGEIALIFNEAPRPGLEIQVTWIRKIERSNYTTKMFVNTFLGSGNQEIYELSVIPEDSNYMFVYVSGILLHNNGSTYTLSGNKLIIPDSIKKDLSINVVIFKNIISEGKPSDQLAGIVTGAVISDKYLKLLRYNAPDFLIPNPHINLTAGNGIEIIGDYPNFKIGSLADSRRRYTPVKRFNTLYTQDNVEEIVYTYKFVYDVDSIITVTADFSARLGPGFKSIDGGEYLEYVLGFKTLNVVEPPYGRRIKGTGTTGFNYLPNAQLAYSNVSITQTYEMNLNKTLTDSVTFVAKMRVRNGMVSKYKSLMDINFSLVSTPKMLEMTM